MASKNTSVLGLYHDRFGTGEAVATLRGAGFRDTDLSVLLQDNAGSKDFGHAKSTKAPEGAVTGGIVGAILGVLAGLGIPEYEARRYKGRTKQATVLLSVHCDSD